MVNWLGGRHYLSADWTSSKMYSLSDKTRSILSDLEEEIRVVVFMTPASPLYDQVLELLDRYAAASDKVKVEYIDPDQEPLRTKQLAEQFGISVANTVVFSYGDRNKYVTSDQMAEYDYAAVQYGQAPTMSAFKGEEQFTSAILSLVAPDVPKVYFVTGHGEASLASAGGGAQSDRSLAVLAEALKRENIEAVDTVLLSGEVPADADVLAIVGPTRPFTEPELAALEAFVDRGGRLLVCLDPLIEPAGTMRATRLEGFLATHGIRVNDDLVVDPSRKLPFYDLSAVYLTDFPSHPVVQGLEGIAVLFSVSRSLTAEGAAAPVVIVETSAEGWGERNLGQLLAGQPVARDDDDTPGPAAVGVVVEEGPSLREQPRWRRDCGRGARVPHRGLRRLGLHGRLRDLECRQPHPRHEHHQLAGGTRAVPRHPPARGRAGQPVPLAAAAAHGPADHDAGDAGRGHRSRDPGLAEAASLTVETSLRC